MSLFPHAHTTRASVNLFHATSHPQPRSRRAVVFILFQPPWLTGFAQNAREIRFSAIVRSIVALSHHGIGAYVYIEIDTLSNVMDVEGVGIVVSFHRATLVN